MRKVMDGMWLALPYFLISSPMDWIRARFNLLRYRKQVLVFSFYRETAFSMLFFDFHFRYPNVDNKTRASHVRYSSVAIHSPISHHITFQHRDLRISHLMIDLIKNMSSYLLCSIPSLRVDFYKAEVQSPDTIH